MIYILLATLFYTTAILLIAVASRNLNTNFAVAVVNTISAMVPLAIVLLFMKPGQSLVRGHEYGLQMAVLAGVSIALFGLATSKAYSVNNVAVVVPIVFGGAIFLSAIYSAVFWNERIGGLQATGLFLLGIGLSIIVYARATAR